MTPHFTCIRDNIRIILIIRWRLYYETTIKISGYNTAISSTKTGNWKKYSTKKMGKIKHFWWASLLLQVTLLQVPWVSAIAWILLASLLFWHLSCCCCPCCCWHNSCFWCPCLYCCLCFIWRGVLAFSKSKHIKLTDLILLDWNICSAILYLTIDYWTDKLEKLRT